MIATVQQPQQYRKAGVPIQLVGEVVYLYAFDLAYEMRREPVRRLLGQPVEPFQIGANKRNPRHHAFYQPQTVRLPAVERVGPHGRVRIEHLVKLLPVGAISITVRVPFKVSEISELVVYHDLQLDTASLNDEVRQLAEKIRAELEPYYVRPVARLSDEEAYTVFCLEAPLSKGDGTITAEKWLQAHRRSVAALLTQESDISHLSDQEAEESTGRYLSYYHDDLVVVDWDAALVIDQKSDFDETLYALELANLQLAELEAYDRTLDEALERSYRDLSTRPLRGPRHVLQELKELRIDLARFSDELSNITKFFGDWHLARVYENVSARFHLPDWHRTLDEKLKTLDDLYQLLQHERNNRWMLVLESTIVLLFIIDLIILFAGLK
jgi:hypothetical protein